LLLERRWNSLITYQRTLGNNGGISRSKTLWKKVLFIIILKKYRRRIYEIKLKDRLLTEHML
jgi:hypothetical protein